MPIEVNSSNKLLRNFSKLKGITVKVLTMGGYGNKLPAIASVLRLSELYECDYRIYWNLDSIISHEYVLPSNIKCEDLTDISQFKKSLITSLGDFQKGNFNIVNNTIYLQVTSPIIGKGYQGHLRSIVKHIKKRIDYESIITEDTIGVHIRRTDHVEWLKQQGHEPKTLEYFFEKMEQNKDKGKFFLATDDEEVSREVKKRYDVLTNDGIEYKRTSGTKSTRSALRDLCSLCECKYIIGTPSSTFSFFPEHLNKSILFL